MAPEACALLEAACSTLPPDDACVVAVREMLRAAAASNAQGSLRLSPPPLQPEVAAALRAETAAPHMLAAALPPPQLTAELLGLRVCMGAACTTGTGGREGEMPLHACGTCGVRLCVACREEHTKGHPCGNGDCK